MTQRTSRALTKSHIYKHLEMEMGSTGEKTCEGTMPIGADIMTPGGLRAALPALLLEGILGNNLIRKGWPVLSNMSYQVRDGADGVARARAVGEVVRIGRTAAINRGRIEDADHPERLLAYGILGFRMIEPQSDYHPKELMKSLATPPGSASDEVRPGILEAMGLQIDIDEGTCELDCVHPGLMGPEGRLHGGAHQLMHEAAAIAAATREAGTDRVRTGEFTIHFIAPTRGGPFVARTQLLSRGSEDLLFGVELGDAEGTGRPCSVSTFRMVIV
ncbi:MAG: PaaI family thioesterase [Phycisphaerales bacterium JB058]